jgi:hypothetical protein
MEAFLAEQPQTAPLTRFRDESGILQSSAQERIAKALSEELQVRLTVVSSHNFAFQPSAFISPTYSCHQPLWNSATGDGDFMMRFSPAFAAVNLMRLCVGCVATL